MPLLWMNKASAAAVLILGVMAEQLDGEYVK